MRSGHFQETYGQLVALSDSRAVWTWTALLVAALLLMPAVAGNYALTIATTICITAIGAIGLNLITGTTGLISLGHSGFLAVGAYTNGILLTDYGWPLAATLPAAGLMSAAVGLVVGVPSLRLKGLYLAITTLAFAFIVNHVILYAEPITHGPNGVFLKRTDFLGIPIGTDRALYYFVLAVTAVMTLAALNILRTRIGRAWLAIRDHDIAARVMGVNLTSYKLLAFVVSSFFTGIAGALIALQIRFVNIDVFNLLLSIEALAMIIFGGLGSVAGAILGSACLILLPELIREAFNLMGGSASATFSQYVFQIRAIAYGVVIVFFLRFEPHGLMGLWRDVRKYWLNWPLAK
jgi:branched-chain amino acid transport system permease protein